MAINESEVNKASNSSNRFSGCGGGTDLRPPFFEKDEKMRAVTKTAKIWL